MQDSYYPQFAFLQIPTKGIIVHYKEALSLLTQAVGIFERSNNNKKTAVNWVLLSGDLPSLLFISALHKDFELVITFL